METDLEFLVQKLAEVRKNLRDLNVLTVNKVKEKDSQEEALAIGMKKTANGVLPKEFLEKALCIGINLSDTPEREKREAFIIRYLEAAWKFYKLEKISSEEIDWISFFPQNRSGSCYTYYSIQRKSRAEIGGYL